MTTVIVKVPLRTGLSPHRFDPEEVSISVGDTVTWRNDDVEFHTVTPEVSEAFEEGTLSGQGATFSITFNTAGEVPYFCQIHPSMTGTVKVEAK